MEVCQKKGQQSRVDDKRLAAYLPLNLESPVNPAGDHKWLSFQLQAGFYREWPSGRRRVTGLLK